MHAGHQVSPATSHSGPAAQQRADGLPHALAQQRADLVGVVVDPVEHLADGLLGQRGERLGQRGVQQVGAQPAFGAVDDARPTAVRPHVSSRAAPTTHSGQQPDQARARVLGQPTRDDRARATSRSRRAASR